MFWDAVIQDGLGGQIKSALAKEQLRLTTSGHPLENAADAVAFLKDRFALGKEQAYGEIQEVNRHFHLIGVSDVNRRVRMDCDTIPGTQKLHSFYGFNRNNPTHLQIRDLSCFCVHCLDFEWEKCEGFAYSGPWRLHTINPKDSNGVNALMTSLAEGEGVADLLDTWDDNGHVGELLTVGAMYAIEAHPDNEWKAIFYVLVCIEPMHSVAEAFTDEYGLSFIPGQNVIKGKWYQPWGRKGTHQSYILEPKSHPSYCLVESVIKIGFCLERTSKKGTAQGYKMKSSTIEDILSSLHRYEP